MMQKGAESEHDEKVNMVKKYYVEKVSMVIKSA
jgi:hypothetical protein